ncbi:MAG: type II secretion system protein GspM [Pseudomonadota bacterium]
MSAFHFANPDLPRRVALCFGGAVAVAIVLFGFIMLGAANNRLGSIADKESIIARADALSGTLASGLSDDAFFPGETPQLAQAAVQTSLQGLAEAHRIDIEMIRADEIEQIDGVVRLNLTINGIAPEAELGAFLYGLASMNPIVVIEDLTLRPARTSRTNPERRITFQASLYGTQKP